VVESRVRFFNLKKKKRKPRGKKGKKGKKESFHYQFNKLLTFVIGLDNKERKNKTKN